MHFLNKFSHDNDVILVHRKLGQKVITLEHFISLHNKEKNCIQQSGYSCPRDFLHERGPTEGPPQIPWTSQRYGIEEPNREPPWNPSNITTLWYREAQLGAINWELGAPRGFSLSGSYNVIISSPRFRWVSFNFARYRNLFLLILQDIQIYFHLILQDTQIYFHLILQNTHKSAISI